MLCDCCMEVGGGAWVCSGGRTDRRRQVGGVARSRLCEGNTSLVVHLEDLLYGVDVRCRPQVEAQVVLVSCAHDLLKGEQKTKNINSNI